MFFSKLTQHIPWWGKIAAKIVLSRIPIPYQIWGQKIGIFRHGEMLNPEYSWKTFDSHYSKARKYLPESFVVCELGPGDSLATSMIAPCFGATESYLIDVDDFSSSATYPYAKLADFLSAKKLNSFNYSPSYSQKELLSENHSYYLTNGLNSLRGIPGNKIDLIFSQAVLEHIRLNSFYEVIKETYRILKPGGVASHKIDLKDHLSSSLNHLRFSKKIWESNLFSNSGFYTNRLRQSEMVEIFKKTGFEIISLQESQWEKAPMCRGKLHSEFRFLSEKDLLVSGLTLIVQK